MRGTVPLFTLDNTVADASVAEEQGIEHRLQGACLVKIYPAGIAGSHIPLTKNRMTFGRSASCDCELNDDHASREHAAIEIRDKKHWIVDNQSMNGTYVNDKKFASCELKSGDHIRIGHHILKYLCSNDVEAMYHEAVFQMMTMDGLTQTYNRRYFEDAFQREVIRSARHGRPLGLLILDLDHFKNLNDRYGHLVGDDILASVCRRIKKRVRTDELFARIGGEEFALVAEIPRQQMQRMAETLVQLINSQPFLIGEHKIDLTVSIGGAHCSGQEPITMKDMWNQADSRLYEAKRRGRNCVRM